MLYCVLWDMFRLQRAAIVSQSLHNMESHSTLPDWEPFRRLLKTSSLTFRPKTPSFQKSNFLRFTYFPLFLNWHPPYFRGACCASTLSTGKCWCRQFPPSHSCRFLKAPPPDTFSDSVFLSAVLQCSNRLPPVTYSLVAGLHYHYRLTPSCTYSFDSDSFYSIGCTLKYPHCECFIRVSGLGISFLFLDVRLLLPPRPFSAPSFVSLGSWHFVFVVFCAALYPTFGYLL